MELKLEHDDESRELEAEDGITVEELLQQQGIELEEVLTAVNGTIVSSRRELEDGDHVKVLEVIAGG